MVEINWSPTSVSDIENIAAYIGRDSYQSACAMVGMIFEKAIILERYPKYGKKVPELNNENLREIPVGRYRIIYEIITDTKIGIVTIHHQSRLLKNNPAYKKLRKRK
jgi:toxin ParE1/3/4